VRDWTGGNPVRIVLDQNSRLQKESCTWQSNKTIVFTKRQLIPTKKPYLYCHRFWKKHSNSIDRCTVWPSDPISDYWRRPTNITNFHWCKFVDEARVFRGTIHLKEGTAAPILSGFSLNKKYNRSRWTYNI
jgi:diaminohydroxyphosphoribosylaminopyrimidine deaminase/5-amino-6-(5-phosphoribosylamino)uracil reductase